MALDHLNIYRHPNKTCETVEVYLNASNHLAPLSNLQNARMMLAYARAALLLDYIPVSSEQIVSYYLVLMKEGSPTDKFEIRLYISDLFEYIMDHKTSFVWLEALESDKVLGLTPDQAARIYLRHCQHFMKNQQIHLAYDMAKNAHKLSLLTDSVELIVISLMQLSSVSKLNGDYILSRQYLSKACRLSDKNGIAWLHGRCLLELGEVDSFLGAGKYALNLYEKARRLFSAIQYAGGYARTSMNLIREVCAHSPEHFQSLLDDVMKQLNDMQGSDPFLLWINVQVLSLYSLHLSQQTRESMQKTQGILRQRIQEQGLHHKKMSKLLIDDLATANYELEVFKQAESSTRLSVGAIDFYRSLMNKKIDTASHEIRNAVSILKMSVEAVKDGHIDINKGMLDTMLKKIESIGCIVDELDLDEEDGNSPTDLMKPVQTNVDHIASYCEMAYAYTDNRVHIHRNKSVDEVFLVATLLPVTQVIDNLVSNALKYSPSHSKVHISYRSSNNFIVFSVLDQGCGISAQDQIHIFEPYFRVSGRKEEGKGLGLHFCRETIETLGGQIWVDSHLGRGSQFSFSLPVKIEA